MADAALYIAIASTLASGASSIQQGQAQKRRAKRSLEQQKQAQAQAKSAASSERLAQAAETKRMQKRKPDASAIMARARSAQTRGETFLSGSSGTGMLGSTRYLG